MLISFHLTFVSFVFPETIPLSTVEVFVFELYSPYTDVFQNYARYEQEQLQNALDTIQFVSSSRCS